MLCLGDSLEDEDEDAAVQLVMTTAITTRIDRKTPKHIPEDFLILDFAPSDKFDLFEKGNRGRARLVVGPLVNRLDR